MFYVSADIAIQSNLSLPDTATAVSDALEIPSFRKDESGRYEEQEVYISYCFGLQFVFGKPNGSPVGEYGLSIDSRTDAVAYDGSEREVDATHYALLLLRRAPELRASAG